MTANATRPTKTKAGGPHHCNQLKNLQETHAALENKHTILQRSFDTSLKKISKMERHEQFLKTSLDSYIEELNISHKRFNDIRLDIKSYKKLLSDLGEEVNALEEDNKDLNHIGQLWRACSVFLVAALIVAAVMVGGIK